MLKISILDDEQHAILNIDKLLASFDDVEVVFKSTQAAELIDFLLQNETDLLFLDIKMPGQSGFDVLDKLRQYDVKGFGVVFLTAYDAYAIKAVKYAALDYLLKPIDRAELRCAINKFKSRKGRDNEKLIKKVLQYLADEKKYRFPSPNGYVYLHANEIVCAKSCGANLELSLTDTTTKIIVQPLSSFISQFRTNHFIQVHRSWCINTNYLMAYDRKKGECTMKWDDNTLAIPVSKRMARNLDELA